MEPINKRVSLYERLPEIYRIKDGEQYPPGQLKSYLGLVESVFADLHKNIETLYHDLFIETCSDWVIPYIGDLLGVSHLKGDAATIRADVADAIALRRRKGTLAGMERLTYNLTRWGVHSVELRENLVWNQHLNHQRPDKGGQPPYATEFDIKLESLADFKNNTGRRAWVLTNEMPSNFYSGMIKKVQGEAITIRTLGTDYTVDYDKVAKAAGVSVSRFTPIRGGTVSLRDPAQLSLLDTPFDPFAHIVDVKPPALGNIRYNLPNLALFLWRLKDYRVTCSKPAPTPPLTGPPPLGPGVHENTAAAGKQAPYIVCFNLHPASFKEDVPPPAETVVQPVRLFNTYRYEPGRNPAVVTQLDEVPGPIPMARLNEESEAAAPWKYVNIDFYDPAGGTDGLQLTEEGLQLHLPNNVPAFINNEWAIRGANLCAWETGLPYPLEIREIAIDPTIGRVALGVETEAEADALAAQLLITYTYGAVGPVGAHPVSRTTIPTHWFDEELKIIEVNYSNGTSELARAINQMDDAGYQGYPIIIKIMDSKTYEFDITQVEAKFKNNAGGITSLSLEKSLFICSADNQRPLIKLAEPLGFRPKQVIGATPAEQKLIDAEMAKLTVRLEGLYITRSETFNEGRPLIARVALNNLEIIDTTLDPGGYRKLDGTRAIVQPAMELQKKYGFTLTDEEDAFNQVPEIIIKRSITGPLLIDPCYTLTLTDTIIDAGNALLFEFEPGTNTENQLDLGNMPTDLEDEFEHHRYTLTTSGTVHVEGATPAWHISDDRHTYDIKKEGNLLKIYGTAISVSSSGKTGGHWGPPTEVTGVTLFGRMRVEELCGKGGIWTHTLEVMDNQTGCVKFSYFSGNGDRLPQNHGCVNGNHAHLRYTAVEFGNPAYGQLHHTSDFRIRERGPDDNEMGAYGFLKEADKWRNLQIRYREFMPVGVRPLLIPVT